MKVTIGLEVHAELKTESKMFCSCKNDPENSPPNENICPICMAHPGALPFANKKAVEQMIKIGLALGGKIADFSEFDRKSYFYPDMPKAYQISQYKYPIVSGGELAGVPITRVHLEEDTARSLHDKSAKYSYIDFNRAGVPLMELVTEPAISSADEAVKFAKELRTLLRVLDVSDADMEKGQMRVEANVSVSDGDHLGTKVEVKNLNSFKSVHDAVNYEVERQISLLRSGKHVVQETRGWDENKQITFSQRVKENASDYRYFPDPDLPKMRLFELDGGIVEKIKSEMPELPEQTRKRLLSLGLSESAAEFYLSNLSFLKLFNKVAEKFKDNEKLPVMSNYIVSDFSGACKGSPDESVFDSFVELMAFVAEAKISSRVAKDIIAVLAEGDALNVSEYIKKNKLEQVSDEKVLLGALQEAIKANLQAVSDYKAGNDKAAGAIMGFAMKSLKEKGVAADPKLLNSLLKDLLESA